MPPSVNEMYANGRYGGRFKTRTARAFDSEIAVWKKDHVALVKILKEMGSTKPILQVDYKFFLKKSRILCKDGKPKRIDVTNRIKAIEDAVSGFLDLDDCYFWSGSFEKYVSPTDLDFVVVTLRHDSDYDHRAIKHLEYV